MFPFVGQLVYFSTDGQVGLAASTSTSTTWSLAAQSCWARQNSFADDFGLNVDSTGAGYMSSNREGGMDHIYNLELIDIIADFEITVVTCDDEVASSVEMDVLNLTG